MIIKNITKKTILAHDVEYAKSFRKKSLGLLMYNSPKALVFKTRFGIHTFLMAYPIDVVIVNNKHKVTKLKKHIAPNSIFIWNPLHDTVIELPVGSIEKSKTEVGDLIELKYHGLTPMDYWSSSFACPASSFP